MSETQMSFQDVLLCLTVYVVLFHGGVQAIVEGCRWLFGVIMSGDGWFVQAYACVYFCTSLYYLLDHIAWDAIAFFHRHPNQDGPTRASCVAIGIFTGYVWACAAVPVTVQPMCRALYNNTALNCSMPGQ